VEFFSITLRLKKLSHYRSLILFFIITCFHNPNNHTPDTHTKHTISHHPTSPESQTGNKYAQWKFRLTILRAKDPTLLHNQAIIVLLARLNPHFLKRLGPRPKYISMLWSPPRVGLLRWRLRRGRRWTKTASLRDGAGARVGTHGRGISVAQL
jgi:hypothetical protein